MCMIYQARLPNMEDSNAHTYPEMKKEEEKYFELEILHSAAEYTYNELENYAKMSTSYCLTVLSRRE